MSENPHHQSSSSSSSQSRLRRSVRFNLDQNTICEKKGAEYSSDADAHWHTNEQVRSMRNSTLLNAMAYRQLVATLRKIQGQANQYGFLSGLLGENDVICIHGIENLVSSVPVRRNLIRIRQQVIQGVIREQARQKFRNDINHVLIAMGSMKRSKVVKDRAIRFAAYHEKDAAY